VPRRLSPGLSPTSVCPRAGAPLCRSSERRCATLKSKPCRGHSRHRNLPVEAWPAMSVRKISPRCVGPYGVSPPRSPGSAGDCFVANPSRQPSAPSWPAMHLGGADEIYCLVAFSDRPRGDRSGIHGARRMIVGPGNAFVAKRSGKFWPRRDRSHCWTDRDAVDCRRAAMRKWPRRFLGRPSTDSIRLRFL